MYGKLSILEEPLEDKIGKTLNIYRELAIALNTFQEAENVSIKDLAEAARVHYNTAKKALMFFRQIDSVMPRFEIEEAGFTVVSKPSALKAVEGIFESLEMRILTKMMLVEADNASKARKLDDVLTEEEKGILPELIERGFVNSAEGMYFLSAQGRTLGSMGLSRIVELNIPLPWEKRATLSSLKEEPTTITRWTSTRTLQPRRAVRYRCAFPMTSYMTIRGAGKSVLHAQKERRFLGADY
jgi:hypothetical protein